jgi:glutamyl-tRNA reductase
VPRDIDPAVGDLENAYLYDIDDLQSVVSSNMKGREEEALQALSIIETEVESYVRRNQMEALSQTFSAIRIEAEAQRAGEVSKTLSRLPDLGEKEHQAIEAMTRAIVNKLLHRPFDVLKKMAEEEMGDDSLSIVQRLFGVEPDDDDLGSGKEGGK